MRRWLYLHLTPAGREERRAADRYWAMIESSRAKHLLDRCDLHRSKLGKCTCGGGVARVAPEPVCATGTGGGEVCARRRGHDGDHDPDSVEVYQ